MIRSSRKGAQLEDIEGGSGDEKKDNSKHDKQQRETSTIVVPTQQSRSLRGLLVMPLVVAALGVLTGASKGWTVLLTIVSIPVTLAASVAAGSWRAQPYQRLIALGFVGAILGNQFPTFVASGLAAVALLMFSLSTRPMQTGKESSAAQAARRTGQVRAIKAVFFAITVLLIENFFVWVVSATYYASHNGSPTPLQDNGRLIQTYLFQKVLNLTRRDLQQLRAMVNVQWALVAALATTFAACEVQWVKKRSLWGLATHATTTLACVRTIRTISFLLTVLPSQMPTCYRNHFPNPPPEDWMNWLLVGLIPQSHGGCNDLIVSGHATVTSILACVSTSVTGHWAFSFALWSLLAMDFSVEVYEGFHYSVDMWMGAVLTIMLWRILAPLEDTKEPIHKQEFHSLSDATIPEIVSYALPSVFSYLALALLPKSMGNYWIMLYCIVALVQLARHGVNHHVQHVFFCLLYIGLGIYL